MFIGYVITSTPLAVFMLNGNNIPQIGKYYGYYKIRLRKTFFVLNIAKSVRTKLAADTRLTEGQFLISEPTLNKEMFLRYVLWIRRLTVLLLKQ